ncbi:Putative sensor with HAMP domain [Rubrivivax sp. A210]|uniref:histidine kinase dimerization/phospho-acceptor domain-containing protein n=1 Tax=Rubrivivax sp. A210 TaxID=2772301 RepID=UPI001919B3D5|nr:histidine kinase dimerization/phospho-acceptor domain-containing protein [Rubrivivax sp. A210]CAD5372293.1 Putative sensor with HAMP domain [Rubrivivax sp. A210]
MPLHRSLRARGWAVTFALLAYVVCAGLYISGERVHIAEVTSALDRLARHERALSLAEVAVNSALGDVGEALRQAELPAVTAELRLHLETSRRQLGELEEHDPGYVLLQRTLLRNQGSLDAQPEVGNWLELQAALRRAADDLDIRHQRLMDQRQLLDAGYKRRYDAVTVESMLLAAVGLVSFGSLAAWFFTQLAHDIGRLDEHARRIVAGLRGVPLAVRREDELGRLMQAVNRMADDLDERERHIQLDIQRRSHEDKMLAVGALAAGVAHEINNPLAVIGGVAQELAGAEPGQMTPEQLAQSARLILAQVERAGGVARQLAEMTALQPAEQDWIDLNALLRRVVRLVGYDRRYRLLSWEIKTDDALPAVRNSAHALQQVLMQMTALACDALVAGSAGPVILRVQTMQTEGGVAVQMLFPPVIDFARPEVQRGLLLCRATIEPLRGQLAFGQDEGALQRIRLVLPADSGSATG